MEIKQQIKNIIQIFFITGFLLYLSIIVRNKLREILVLKKKLGIKIPVIYSYVFWSSTHLVMHILLGFFAPNLWYISYILSSIWELIEYALEDKIYFLKFKISDFFVNGFGLFIGIHLHKKYYKNYVKYMKTKK